MPSLSLSEFADRVQEVMPVIMKEFMRRQAGDFYKTNITMPQFFVLELLQRLGESKMSAVAKYIQVSTAAMTGIVARLVRAGYLVRTSDSQDRRIVMVKLTARGSAAVKETIERRKQATIKIFGGISPKDREKYLNILDQVREHLKDA